jgi:hypothetical protein
MEFRKLVSFDVQGEDGLEAKRLQKSLVPRRRGKSEIVG